MNVRWAVTAAILAVLTGGAATPAVAATYPPIGPTAAATVLPTRIVQPAVAPAVTPQQGSAIPFTGAEIAALSVIGVALFAVGSVLVVFSHRRPSRISMGRH